MLECNFSQFQDIRMPECVTLEKSPRASLISLFQLGLGKNMSFKNFVCFSGREGAFNVEKMKCFFMIGIIWN